MKKLINLLALSAILGLTGLMTGCGGDDDDDDDVGGAGGGGGPTAPATVAGQEVTITEAGGSPRSFKFSTSGNTFTVHDPSTGNAIQTGTFQYNASNNTGTLSLRDPDGSNPVTYNLTFSSGTSGTFSFTSPGGQLVTGTFSDLKVHVPGDTTGGGGTGGGGTDGGTGGGTGGGGTDGGTGGGGTGGGGTGGGGTDGGTGGGGTGGGGTDGGTGGGGTGGGGTDGGLITPPTSVAGRSVVVNATSGPLIGATTITFGAGNTFNASNSGSGNYTYTLTGNSATITLDYTAPTDFAGDRDVFVVTFNPGTGAAGSFTGTTKIDDAESPHSGTFQIQ